MTCAIPENTFAAAGGAELRDLVARMGHDSERAALVYQHQARGADKIITDGLDTHVEAEWRKPDDDEGVGGVLAPVPQIQDSADIWEHVQFRHPPEWRLGGGPLTPGRSYLSFEGEVSWEPEHGLQLVYEDGQRVCKVSQYDGHVTVAHAYGDPSLLGVVFG
jgi:uncharacterized protein DUF6985